MPDISQLTNDLRGLPDQALQQALAQPNPLMPGYLVLAEAQRRASMRQAAQQEQAKGSSSTVLQDVVRNMMSGQPPPGIAPAGATPPKMGQGPTPGGMGTPTPPQPPPQGMRRGGRYAEGGETDDDEDDGDDIPDAPVPSVLRSRLLPTPPAAQSLVNRVTPTKYRPSANDIDGWIDMYGQKYGVDPDMGRAIMGQESRGQTNAVSPKGASGLFQLMPSTAKDMGVDPRVPQQNVEGGMKYYGQLLQQFHGDHQLALAAYNAGPAAVQHYGGVPPFDETQKYVPAILGRYSQLKQQQQPPDLASLPTESRQPTLQATAAAAPTPTAIDDSGGQGAGVPDSGATFDATAYAPPPHGRIHQTLDELGVQEKAIRDQMAQLKDPYDPANMNSQRQNILQFYGLPPNYLQSIDSLTQQKKAAILQYQEEAAQRFHHPNPWEFLSNIAAGMGQSKSLNFAGAFGEGVGHAWAQRDQQQQAAFNEWNALQQDADKIDATADQSRGRFDTVLEQILTHQGTINEAQRKTLMDQLTKNTVEQDKFKKLLVPTNALQPLYNPGDYDKEDWQRSVAESARVHGWNKDRMQKEIQAVQMLAQRGDSFQQNNGQYASAYDQFMAKYPNEAGKLNQGPSKFSDADIASYANSVNAEPAGLYDPKVVPKDAVTPVRAYMAQQGMRIPVQPPNKALQDSAALGYRTLTHIDRLNNFAQDPWLTEHVFGPWAGRMAKGEEKVGMDQLDLQGATPQQTRDTQDMLTSLNYLRMIEGKGLLGGRPAVQLMQQLMQTTPDVHMALPRFLGAMDATRASANMAIQSHRDWMYGARSTNAIPAGARVAQDANGRKIMQAAPGKPWLYMDTNEPVK